jgi:hypothetical protein
VLGDLLKIILRTRDGTETLGTATNTLDVEDAAGPLPIVVDGCRDPIGLCKKINNGGRSSEVEFNAVGADLTGQTTLAYMVDVLTEQQELRDCRIDAAGNRHELQGSEVTATLRGSFDLEFITVGGMAGGSAPSLNNGTVSPPNNDTEKDYSVGLGTWLGASAGGLVLFGLGCYGKQILKALADTVTTEKTAALDDQDGGTAENGAQIASHQP